MKERAVSDRVTLQWKIIETRADVVNAKKAEMSEGRRYFALNDTASQFYGVVLLVLDKVRTWNRPFIEEKRRLFYSLINQEMKNELSTPSSAPEIETAEGVRNSSAIYISPDQSNPRTGIKIRSCTLM